MKNLLSSKKSIITIIVSLIALLLFVTILLFTSNHTKSSSHYIDNQDILYGGNGPTIEPENLQTVISRNEKQYAEFYMSGFAYEWPGVKEIVNIESIIEIYYSDAINLSQTVLNSGLNLRHKISADNTCSLIAIMIALDIISKTNNNIQYNYNNFIKLTDFIDMLKDLYEISTTNYGNIYDPNANNIGTYSNTISGIITDYFTSKGFDIDSTYYNFSSDATNNIADNMGMPPAIIGIKNYYLDDGNHKDITEAGHSVACVGYDAYNITYTTGILNKKVEKPSYIYIICDGYTDSGNGKFGSNFQYLIVRNNANINLSTFNDWLNH